MVHSVGSLSLFFSLIWILNLFKLANIRVRPFKKEEGINLMGIILLGGQKSKEKSNFLRHPNGNF